MKIIVTGAGGFIGSHLVDVLLDQGHVVIGVDNFLTGQKENLAHQMNNPNFTLIEHDVVEPSKQLEALEGVDQIYHLACPASPVAYQKEPIRTVKTNVVGTLNMLELALKLKARILLSSTSEVYGDPLIHPQTEEYWGNVNPIGLRACYDEGKRCAETLTFEFHRCYGLEVRVARIFNTYGPRMAENDGRVVSNFIVQALTSNGITVFGDGSQTRSFCYVSDTVQGLVKLMNGSNIGPINLGNPNETTVLTLAQKIAAMVSTKAEIIFKPLPADDPTKRKPDITKAQTILGWEPAIDFSEGLQKTIEYFREFLKKKEQKL